MAPDVVPEKLDNPINYKILGLIIFGTILFQISISMFPESEVVEEIVFVVSIVNPLAASISCFIISKRYKDTQVFGKAYFYLGLAYLMVFFAELTYLIYERILFLDPYPSIADVFFFLLYPFTLIHLILNIRFFQPKFSNRAKIWLIVFPVAIFFIYTLSAIDDLGNSFDLHYGIIFTIGSAVTLGFAILGAAIFREGVIGKAWLLLVLGILATTVGDVWYYHLEIFGEYGLTHPVNLFWYTSYWIIIYALYKHKEII